MRDRTAVQADSRIGVFSALMLLLVMGTFLYYLFRKTPLPPFFWESDKVLHCGSFAAVVILGHWLLAGCAWCRRSFFVLVVILAVGSEFVQGSPLLPQRSFDPTDLLMNVTGCLIGVVVLVAMNRWRSGAGIPGSR